MVFIKVILETGPDGRARFREEALPLREEVKGACEILGLDPLYLANEGKLVAVVAAADADRVVDFAVGVDKLAFTAANYGLVAGAPLAAANFTAGISAIGGTAQFVYDNAARTLSWDADGNAAGAAVLIATFDTAIALGTGDFVLI